ncbi:hypothetical protein PTW32_10880 [Dechloromonas agitata]|uniref:hypothetical protein n=1 Tax=Dechloromonas agitata TaxID=73030 RepID=UPI00237D7108|nr:hypothetical protein [Dechloromonas agitata]MDE1545924.1 hypothetical protein [Dechloromonas agitata]
MTARGILEWVAKKKSAQSGTTYLPHEVHMPLNLEWRWECKQIDRYNNSGDIEQILTMGRTAVVSPILLGSSTHPRFTRLADESWEYGNAKRHRLSSYFFDFENMVLELVSIYGYGSFALQRGWSDINKNLLKRDGVRKVGGVLEIDVETAKLRGATLEGVGPVIVTGNVGRGIIIQNSSGKLEESNWARDLIRKQNSQQSAMLQAVEEAKRLANAETERKKPASMDLVFFVQRVTEAVNTLDGRFDPMDRGLTFGDLVENGLADVTIDGAQYAANTPQYPVMRIEGTGEVTDIAVDPPSTPVGLTADGLVKAVWVRWTDAAYTGHAYTLVFRADDNDPEQATLIGSSYGNAYVDATDNYATRYYFLRHINRNGELSPMSAGVTGSAGRISGAEMGPLIVTAQQLAAIDGASSAIDGQLTGSHIAAATLKAGNVALANAAIKSANIGTAVIGNAQFLRTGPDAFKVKNIHLPTGAGAVLDGTHIADAQIGNAQIDRASANKLKVSGFNIGTAQITTAKIDDLQITGSILVEKTGYWPFWSPRDSVATQLIRRADTGLVEERISGYYYQKNPQSFWPYDPGNSSRTGRNSFSGATMSTSHPYSSPLLHDELYIPIFPVIFPSDGAGGLLSARVLLYLRFLVMDSMGFYAYDIKTHNNIVVQLPVNSDNDFRDVVMSGAIKAYDTNIFVGQEWPELYEVIEIEPNAATVYGGQPLQANSAYSFFAKVKPINLLLPCAWDVEYVCTGILK